MGITIDHQLSDDWVLIKAGPTSDHLFIEANGTPLFFRIDTAIPTSKIGHKLDNDTHGQAVTLNAGESLYAKSLSDNSHAIVTGE